MIYASYNYNMSTFKVFLSFSFCFILMFTKTIHPLPFTRKLFFVHLHSYTWWTFSVYALELFFFMSTRSIYKPYSCSKISFFHFFPHTPVVYTKVSLYTLVTHTHKNFFSHIIYTHKILLYTFSFYIYKNLSFSLYT